MGGRFRSAALHRCVFLDAFRGVDANESDAGADAVAADPDRVPIDNLLHGVRATGRGFKCRRPRRRARRFTGHFMQRRRTAGGNDLRSALGRASGQGKNGHDAAE